MAARGVRVGPLDPETTAEFGQVSAQHSARQVVRLHAQAYPGHLTAQLARPIDPERTKGLDKPEVLKFLQGEKLENGDPAVPEGTEIVGIAVRGERDGLKPQILSYVFRTESGRTGKWFVEYNADKLPKSTERGDEAVRVHELRERGLVPFDDQGAESQRLRSENAQLHRRLEELERQSSGDQGQSGDGQSRSLEDDEPVDGYDKLKADDAAKLLRSEDLTDEQRQEILDYERKHQNRATVTRAGEAALDHA